jgi:transcriptional regulator with XRE-family HTH domain
MTFSERLDGLLKARGMTAKQLTQELGIGATTVSDWKREKSSPSPAILVKMAHILNVSVDYLLGIEKTVVSAESPDSPQTPDERSLIEKYRTMSPEKRKALDVIIGSMLN